MQADGLMVMYGGQVVEQAPVRELCSPTPGILYKNAAGDRAEDQGGAHGQAAR